MTTTEPDRELPHVLADRLRACGATEAELDRLWAEHEQLEYYDRFVANQRVPTDDASVYALLLLTRERWEAEDSKKTVESDADDSDSADDADDAGNSTRSSAVVDTGSSERGSNPELQSAAPQTVTSQTTSQTTTQALQVPDHARTMAQVLDWVRNDKAKARVALDTELASDDTRTSLVANLRKILEG